MARTDNPAEGGEITSKPKFKKGLLIGLASALMLGGGGFFAVYSGLLLGSNAAGDHAADKVDPLPEIPALPPVAFVELEPLVISLGRGNANQHLRFRAQLEVDPKHQADVTTLAPRVLDVLNSYLRAVEVSDLENPASLVLLRAQMLRRIQLVCGEGRVRDLLIMEFVLN
jgi:flagellar FliL protein